VPHSQSEFQIMLRIAAKALQVFLIAEVQWCRQSKSVLEVGRFSEFFHW